MPPKPRPKRTTKPSQNAQFNAKADAEAEALRVAITRSGPPATKSTDDIYDHRTPLPTNNWPSRSPTQSQPYGDLITTAGQYGAGSPILDPLLRNPFKPSVEEQCQSSLPTQLEDDDGDVELSDTQNPDNYALVVEDGEQELQDTQDVDGSQRRAQRTKFPWDKPRELELIVLKMHAHFIKLNRHRQGGLRKAEKDAIVAATLKAARIMYPDKAASLSLDWVQCKTKEDWYQRKTTAAERLLYECSGYGINWLTGQVTAADATWEKYCAMECHKEARFLRYNVLPGVEWCREIWGQRTATGEMSSGGVAAATAVARERKRKRTVEAGDDDATTPSATPSAPSATPSVTKPQPEEEDDGDSEPGTVAVRGRRTPRTPAAPIVASGSKKPAGAETLATALRWGFDRLAMAKMHPIETMNKARTKMLDFFPTFNCQRFCLQKFKDPDEAAMFATGTFEYRLRFLGMIQDDYDTPDYFKERVEQVDRLRAQYNEQRERIFRAKANGRKCYTVLMNPLIIEGIDLRTQQQRPVEGLRMPSPSPMRDTSPDSEATHDSDTEV